MSEHPESYTVAWICALPIEHTAACALLDRTYSKDESPSQSIYDANSYSFGQISGHNIVIASPPVPQYGHASSATVISPIQISFPEVRFCLLVGIGGGVPNNKHDIRLGDVVINSPTPFHGGVIQYDYGKSISDQKFVLSANLPTPPESLLNAMSQLRSQHKHRGHQIQQTITNLIKEKRLKEEFHRPNAVSDVLFGADQEGTAIERSPRNEKDVPVIHYGTIASGNQVIKDARVRDTLAAQNGVICFEMEAAGLENMLPCLVIRGICDYSDSHKDDVWQRYAAATAAVYAAELLGVIAPTNATPKQALEVKNEEDLFQDAAGRILRSVAHLKSLILSTHVESTMVLQLEGCLFILRRVVGALLTAGLHGQHTQAAVLQPLLDRIATSMVFMGSMLGSHMSTGDRPRNLKSRPHWTVQDKDKMNHRIGQLSTKVDKLVTFVKSHNLAILPDIKSASAPADDLIIVMGQTGVGKSQLIQKITGSWDVKIGHTLESETLTIAPYSVLIDGRTVTLIDTPGFDDSELTDAEVLSELASWMASTFSKGYHLSGILYLSPITASRMTGTSLLGFEVFEQLVGKASYSNIILVTTMWDLLNSKARGEIREEQLKKTFWKNMLAVGSRTMQSFGNEESAVAIVRSLISGHKQSSTTVPLAIQREMVEEEKPLASTAAGEIFAAKLAAMASNYDEQFRKVQAELNLLSQRNAERMEQVRSLQAQVDVLRAERETLGYAQGFEAQMNYNEPPPYMSLEQQPPGSDVT